MKKIFLCIVFVIATFISGMAQTVSISGNQFTVNGKQIWFNGINTPWQNWADFGGGFTPSWWRTEFQRYSDNKINLARVWVHCNGMNSPTTNTDGSVTGTTALFWQHMDSLVAISKAKKIYILPCLWSFDMVKVTNTATYQRYRNLLNSQANIQSYIDNFLIPLIKRYNNEPYVLGWEICNEPEWMFKVSENGPMTKASVQMLHAMCAAAIHKNCTKPVTTGAASVKWNSPLYENTGDDAGNVWSNTALQSVYNDPQAFMDFWQVHWYPWMTQWYYSPFQKTTAYFLLDDKPVLVGETQGLDQCDAYVCQTLTQMYENSYLNGFDGVCGWKTPQNDGFGTFENISVATNAFHTNHPQLVYPSGTQTIPVTGVTVTPATVSINAGATSQLTATVAPANATNKTVTWSSSNTAIATVSISGLVTGVAAGAATITVTTQDGSKIATSVITVSNTTIPVTGVTLSPATASINIGGTTQLTATIAPANATNKTVTWSSSNTAIATVSTTGLVTGVAAGSATITVTTVSGSRTATSVITVSNTTIPVTGVTLTPATTSINVGGTTQLTATVAPANATNKTVTWSSSNTAIATVSTTGLVTGVAAGSATITVTTVSGSRTATSVITVTNTTIPVTGVTLSPTTASINVGGTTQLTATVAPANATNKTVTWSSSNTAIATVSTTGLVTGVAAGSATITVTTVSGGRTATSVITVTSTSTSCTFGTPLASGLPTINGSYNKVYVLGTGGPALANVTNFTINWSLSQNGLWQLSINTNNGQPTWWIDLRTVSTWKFNQAQPEITFTNSGFAGLDGAYWATVHGSNFVLVSKTKGYAIYFSNSTTAPVCTGTLRLESDATSFGQTNLVFYPNPFNESITLQLSNPEQVKGISLTDQLGKEIARIEKSEISNSMEIGSKLERGVYYLRVQTSTGVKSHVIIKK